MSWHGFGNISRRRTHSGTPCPGTLPRSLVRLIRLNRREPLKKISAVSVYPIRIPLKKTCSAVLCPFKKAICPENPRSLEKGRSLLPLIIFIFRNLKKATSAPQGASQSLMRPESRKSERSLFRVFLPFSCPDRRNQRWKMRVHETWSSRKNELSSDVWKFPLARRSSPT